jgi:hypothetical protein
VLIVSVRLLEYLCCLCGRHVACYITINTFKHIKTSNSEEHVWPRNNNNNTIVASNISFYNSNCIYCLLKCIHSVHENTLLYFSFHLLLLICQRNNNNYYYGKYINCSDCVKIILFALLFCLCSFRNRPMCF